PQGGYKALGVEAGKFSWPATASTETITTHFKRIHNYRFSAFPGTVTHALTNGTNNDRVTLDVTIQGAVDGTAIDHSFGFVAGTADTNTLTLQRAGTAVGDVTYTYVLEGY